MVIEQFEGLIDSTYMSKLITLRLEDPKRSGEAGVVETLVHGSWLSFKPFCAKQRQTWSIWRWLSIFPYLSALDSSASIYSF